MSNVRFYKNHNDMYEDFDDWKPDVPPEPDYTPLPLSQALGFIDSWDNSSGTPVFVTAREKFNAYVNDPANWVDLNKDGDPQSLRLIFQTSIFDTGDFSPFSTGVFNDKILRIAPVLIGDAAHLDPNHDDTSIRLKQEGTCYLRSKDAVIGGLDSFMAYNMAHAFEENEPTEARLNSYHEWINIEDLADSEIDTRGSLGLLWRSVGCTQWVLTITHEGNIDAENGDIDFSYLEDIVLNIKHRNFGLPTVRVASCPVPREVVAPLGQARLMVEPDAAYRFTGTLLPEQPGTLRPEPLTLYLESSGSDVVGMIEANGLLNVPELDLSGAGPALTGTVIGGAFQLASEIYASSGGISRTLVLTTTTVYSGGAMISGEYKQFILGMAPVTIQVSGVFTLTQSILSPVASFSAVPAGSLTMNFLNWSQGNPTSYLWTFGDGSTSTEASPTHVYPKPGPYTVTLTVSNLLGSDTMEFVIYVMGELYLPLIRL